MENAGKENRLKHHNLARFRSGCTPFDPSDADFLIHSSAGEIERQWLV